MFKRQEYQNYWIARGCWETEACSANPFFFRGKHFESPVLVVQAHWFLAPKPVAGAQPRPFTVRFHYYHIREHVVRLAVLSQLQWGEKKIYFPNFRETVRKQHRQFDMVWQRCREAGMAFWSQHIFQLQWMGQHRFLRNTVYCPSLFKKWMKEHYQVATVKDRITQIPIGKGIPFE